MTLSVENHEQKNALEGEVGYTDRRPWGSYTILEKGRCYQVKRLVVDPKGRLSVQLHKHRDEHWVVVRGEGEVTIGEERRKIFVNQSVFIPKLVKHRMVNCGDEPLEIVEVQIGSYLEEDDIVRFEDDYGRH